MKYIHEANVKFKYNNIIMRGAVLFTKSNNANYIIATIPDNNEIENMLIALKAKKLNKAMLNYYDLNIGRIPNKQSYTVLYSKFIDYFVLEIEEGDIIGEYWKPSGNWSGWIIKDE